MKKRSSSFYLALALLLLPALAMAAPPAPVLVEQAPACGQLASPAAAPDAGAPALQPALGLSPLDGALAMAGNCCDSLRRQCEANCRNKGGISEFNCFPDSCMASCICNVFP
jgi:hypothetical protein